MTGNSKSNSSLGPAAAMEAPFNLESAVECRGRTDFTTDFTEEIWVWFRPPRFTL